MANRAGDGSNCLACRDGECLPTFFTRPERLNWQHLWFLVYLFTFTLLYLPFFLRLAGSEARDRGPVRPVAVYLPLLPLAAAQILLRSRWPGYQNLVNDRANFVYYSLYLILGFLLAARPAFERAVHAEWKRAGLLGLAAAVALIPPTISYPVEWLLATVAGYGLVVFLLGAGARYLTFTNSAHRYWNEVAFPVYLLHQPVIVGLGYFIIRPPWGIPAKFGLLLGGSLVATMVLYHFIVRPVGILRFACGMKPKRRGTPAIAPGT